MVPIRYCQKPDGDYHRWNHGNVEPAILSRWNPDQEFVYIYGIVVYGLVFTTEHGGLERWNCQYGWDKKGML